MEKVVEKMAKFFGSPIAKWVGCLLAGISVICLTSFTTNRSVKEQLSDYVSYQNKQVIIDALNETVMPTLEENSKAIARLETKVDSQGAAIVAEIIRQIEKNYEKYQKGDFSDIAETNLKYVSDNWVLVPDSKRTDLLKKEYEVIIEYYARIKK